jgi:hypothetical protein
VKEDFASVYLLDGSAFGGARGIASLASWILRMVRSHQVRTVRTLLEPVIGEKSAGGPKYSVYGNVILGSLEFLAKRG